MKKLQDLIRSLSVNEIAEACGKDVTEDFQMFCDYLATSPNVVENPQMVLFAAEYLSWDPDELRPDFTASVYDADRDQDIPILFVPWKDLLGYSVSTMSIECYGLEQVIAAIIREMTYFGYNEEESKRVHDSLLEMAQPDDEDDLSFEEVLEQSGMTMDDVKMTPEEATYTRKVLAKNNAIRDNQILAIRAILAEHKN